MTTGRLIFWNSLAKWCSKGACISNPMAPNGTCLFGDLYLKSHDRKYGMSCEEGLQYYSENGTISPKTLCLNETIAFRCCSNCKSKNSFLEFSACRFD